MLAVEPAQQDRDSPGVVAQPVSGTREHPELHLASGGVRQGPGVEQGDDLVVRSVHEQDRPGRHLGDLRQRADLS